MAKHLKRELYVLLHRWPALLLILAALIGNYWMGGTHPIGTEVYNRRVGAKSYWLMSFSEFQSQVLDSWYISSFTHHTIEDVVERYGLEEAGVEVLEDIYPLLAKDQYIRLLWFLGGLVFLCIILPPTLIRYPLDTGIPALTARLTKSGRMTVLAQIIVYYLCILLVSLISTLTQIEIYADSIASQSSLVYVMASVTLRLLMDMAVMSLPMYLAFLIRSVPGLVMVNTAYGIICYALNVAACNEDGLLPIPIPAYLHGLRPIWQMDGPGFWIAYAALISLGWIVLFIALSVRCFEREGKKGFSIREAEQRLKAAN